MGKFKTRLNSRKTAKRWKKGQSSLCNPETSKHRDAARSMNFSQNLSSKMSGLTIDKLKTHDAMQGVVSTKNFDVDNDDDMDGASTCKTFNTYASNFSKCSNMSFDGFLNHYQTKSSMHQEMLATLRTVTEAIKEKGGTESTVEYFAAFIATLKQMESEETESENTVAALITLLGMTMKNVQKPLLKQKFGLVNQLLHENLIKYNSDYIHRHCLGCMSVLLRAQEKAVWFDDSTKNTMNTILTFTTNSKPKLRKAAQHAIISILKDSEIMKQDNPPPYHPAVSQVANYLIKELNEAQRQDLRTSALHIMSLLKDVAQYFPKHFIKTICNQMLANMKLNNDPIVATCCFETLYSLFVSRPPSSSLPPELNAQIINALYDYQPSNENAKLSLPWLTTVLEALCNLASTSLDLCAAHTPKFLNTCMKIWSETNKQEVQDGVATKLKDVITLCVAPLCVDTQNLNTGRSKSVILEVIKILSSGLNFIYNAVWRQVFNLIAILFQTVGPVEDKDIETALKNVLRQLVDLRESKNISFAGDADYAVGAAIKALGAEKVLNIAPLIDDGNLNLHRYEWLFTVLDTCTSHSTIAYFKDHFLNPAISYDATAEKKKATNEKNQAEAYEQLCVRVWALLPSFCNNATDIAKSLDPHFAMSLGKALEGNKKHLHQIVVSGLRKLLLKAANGESVEDTNCMARFAKNFLPRLNNVYLLEPKGTHEQGTRASALETIKVYLKLDHPDIKNVIKRLNAEAKKCLEKADSDFRKESLYDLMMVYSKYTDFDQLNEFYNSIKPLLKDVAKQKEQKKAYRFLEEICCSDTEVCQQFLQVNWQDLKQTIIDSNEEALKPSKGPRIRILTALVESCVAIEDDDRFLTSVIVESILGVRVTNAKCRTSSFELFNVLAEKFQHDEQQFKKFLDMIKAGLGGTPFYRSATILVLTSILYNYSATLDVESTLNILDCILEQMQEPIREVVKSTFAFVKIFLSVSPNTIIFKRLENIVKTLCEMTEDCKRHFRLKVRDILTKLIRKYGFEIIANLVPTTDEIMHKRIKNIRKIETRKQKSKHDKPGKNEDEDELLTKRGPKTIEEILADSDEEDDEDDVKSKKENRESRKRKSAWIQEESDKILDFTDPGVSKKITTSKPSVEVSHSEEGKPKRERGFKVAPDGRLVISDIAGSDDDDEPTQKKKKRKLAFLGDDADDYDDNEDDMKTSKSMKSNTSLKSNKSATTRAASSYKAGGTGIHRPLNPGEEYASKKAAGDVKKKGKLEPYAYVPLRRSTLNRRKKHKNGGDFKGLIGKGKKGKRTNEIKNTIKKAMKK